MKKIVAVLCVVLFLITIVGLYLRSETKNCTIQTELEKVELSMVWQAAVSSVDLQNQTANLEWLHLKVSDRKIQSLHLEFTGKNSQGKSRMYYVDVNSLGRVKIHSKSVRELQPTTHPMNVLRELDKFGLENVGADYTLDISFEWGDLGFNSSYGNLYLLKEGKLIPLEKVVFHTNIPICRIDVCKGACETWFVQNDLLRAEKVVFKEIT